MALARLTNWTDGDILTSAALEAELDQIYNSSLSLVSPWTANMAAGGFSLTGIAAGSAAVPSISFTADTNTGIFSLGPDTVNMAAGGANVFSTGLESSLTVLHVISTDAGATGPLLSFDHDSASPADNDNVAGIRAVADDDTGTARVIGSITYQFQDVTSTTMDSALLFAVMNAVNAGNAATTASLSSLGVWTDASAAAEKEYIGDIQDVIAKVRQLTTLGVYHAKNLPDNKKAGAERHYSTTAEDFFSVFGLGRDPAKSHPGIAPKDVAWLAVKMALELDARLQALEP